MASVGRARREEAVINRRLLRMERERRPRSISSTLVVPAAVLALPVLAVAILLGGASGPVEQASGEGVTLAAVAADPERFHGQEVTIVGAVEERYRRHAFNIGHTGSRDDVLVLPRGRAERHLRRNTPRGTVRVTGKVRYVGKDLAGAIGGDVAVLRGGAAITATRVERVR